MVLKKVGTLAILMSIGGGIAHADLTYTTKVSAGNGRDLETTTYMKGIRVRTEAEGRITITDGTRTYLINTEKKTYSVIANKKLDSTANPMMEQFNQMIDMKMDVSVKPGGKTRTILGKPAKNYLYTMTMRMNFKPGSGPKNATGKGQMRLPTFQTIGETWTTEALPAPPASAAAMTPGAAFRNLGMLGSTAKSAAASFQKIKGFPLESTMTQKTVGGSMPGMEGKGGGRNLVIKMNVVSLKTDAVDAGLFAPQKGFKQVPYEPPTMPSMSGLAGGGGGGM
ncbi:MAG: hypothetical protein QM758_25490 [Armatimonas sp.]